MSDVFNPLVSIIIPVYNGSNYVKEAIDSALAQTYKNIEVIVVNDGSTDNTEKIVKSYGDKIRYFYKENGGVASALNLAIENSKGEYISWLSHDDVYYPNKIQKQIEALSKLMDNNMIIFSNYIVLRQEDKIEFKNKLKFDNSISKQNILRLLFCSGLHGCSLLIPKDCFRKVSIFDTKLKTTQDYDLWFKFIHAGYNFYFVDEYLIKSRIHRKQDSLSKIDLCNMEKLQLFKTYANLFFKEIVVINKADFNDILKELKTLRLCKLIFWLRVGRLLRFKAY